jgi:hypothetical protein
MHKIDNPKETTETITAAPMFHPDALPVPGLASFAVPVGVVLDAAPGAPAVAITWPPPYRVVTLASPPTFALVLIDVAPVVRAVGELGREVSGPLLTVLAPDIIPV